MPFASFAMPTVAPCEKCQKPDAKCQRWKMHITQHMRRSYLLRRPNDDEDELYSQELVKSKPIEARLAKSLGSSYSGGKDFVKASQKSQQEFYGSQTILHDDEGSSEQQAPTFREMTHDERNKLSASIIKAQLKGDMERVNKLRRKLEEGIIEIKAGTEEEPMKNIDGKKTVILMEMDKKSGLTMPSRSQQKEVVKGGTTTGVKRKGTVEAIYEKQMELSEIMAEEKRTTAEDQITMFNRTAKVCSDTKTGDDWNFDDNMLSHPKKKRHEEKDARLEGQRKIKEHKFVERTLNSCPKCIESRLFEKHSIVATGIKTYLAVVNWDGLSPDHCYIAPMEHYASSVVLDEDVWEEMRLWMKGLVTMWRDDDEQDCVFVENAIFLREQRHMTIECIPLPKEVGDMSPIYFKKAIMESEKEWSDNKKLLELSKNNRPTAGVRGVIPKGFPYFSVNFGLQPGYAHIIEDERNFPINFAQEIIGGMLDLDHRQWKNPKRQTFDEVKQKRQQLEQKWAKYDWTEIVKRGIRGGEIKHAEKNDGGDDDEVTEKREVNE